MCLWMCLPVGQGCTIKQTDTTHMHPKTFAKHTHPKTDAAHTHPKIDATHTHPKTHSIDPHLHKLSTSKIRKYMQERKACTHARMHKGARAVTPLRSAAAQHLGTPVSLAGLLAVEGVDGQRASVRTSERHCWCMHAQKCGRGSMHMRCHEEI